MSRFGKWIKDPAGYVRSSGLYCGYENGDRVLGQIAEVATVVGNQVELNLPLHWTYDPGLAPWAYQVDAYALIHDAGLEDLTLTQDAVAATLLRHGNYDHVTGTVVWDASTPDRDLPPSLYRTTVPEWWRQETPWPAIGPDVDGYVHAIPAKRRFEGLPCNPVGAACPNGSPGKVAVLQMSRNGADIHMTWAPDANAGGGYNVYSDDTEENVLLLRSPGRAPVLSGVTAPCVSPDALNTGLLYWQVVGVCPDGRTEGQN